MNFTAKWKISYDIYYDLENSKKISDGVSLTRDMHCWEGIFNWVPSGSRKGWYFRINVKDLPDVKIEGSKGRVRS